MAADLNGDGKADLIFYSGRLSVTLNDGSGHFTAQNQLPMPEGFTSANLLALGDFDNDNFKDIAACIVSNTASTSSVALAIYLNNRSGHFNLVQTIPVPACMGLGAGDANRDGKTDVALGYSTGQSSTLQNIIVTYFGDGTGHFNSSAAQSNMSLNQQQQTDANPCHLHGMGGADFDGEGTLDLIVFALCEGGAATEGAVYFARGDGTGHYLLTEITEGVGTINGVPEIRDTNRDGMLDFGYVNLLDGPHASTVSTLRLGVNSGAGIFRMSAAHTENTYAGSGTVLNAGSFSDVTGDGIYDAVVGFSSHSDCCEPPPIPQGIVIKIGQSDGTFTETQRWGTSGVPTSIATADFDGNGAQDIAVATVAVSGGEVDAVVYLNKGK
jgi:FG-GAP-like repeat